MVEAAGVLWFCLILSAVLYGFAVNIDYVVIWSVVFSQNFGRLVLLCWPRTQKINWSGADPILLVCVCFVFLSWF